MMFDVDVAKEYGIGEAIMIKNFQFWISKNRANEQNFYDNHYWTYNSKRAFLEIFPFWSEQNIKTILNHLKEKGVIITGNFNTNKHDHTLWYAFAQEDVWLPNQPIDRLELTNRFAQTNKSITDNITDIPPDNNIIINNNILSAPQKGTMAKPTLDELKEYIKEKGYTFDAESFMAYYDSNGWMIGKQKMKNWKAACVTWQRNGFGKKQVEEKKEFYW